jgi:thiamine biosynthesis protein ThiI
LILENSIRILIFVGNALSQVASQTIENINATHVISDIPLITPLFGFNKEEITAIAHSVNTFKTSTCEGTDDCCVMYMPKNPKTKANINIVMKYVDAVPTEVVESVTIKVI